MSKEIIYKNLIAFHPGTYVMDIIEDLNITQKEFAKRLGTTEKSLSKLLNAKDNLSNTMASKLSKLTGTSIKSWLNLQSAYDEKALEINERQSNDENQVCSLIDFKYFKDNGFVENRTFKLQEKIEKLRSILRVSNLTYLEEFNTNVSYRNIKVDKKSIVNSNVMLEIASNMARNKSDIRFNKDKLIKYLPEIRGMTVQAPSVFYPRLAEILLECGIVLVALPKLKNASINGSTKRFKNGSIMLLITDRNKDSDIFWFSIIHEISHILDGDFYSDNTNETDYIEKEQKADTFARNFYIDEDSYNNFINNSSITKQSIIQFADSLGIHPSLVLGRLQKDNRVGYNKYYDLKEQYTILLDEH